MLRDGPLIQLEGLGEERCELPVRAETGCQVILCNLSQNKYPLLLHYMLAMWTNF